MTGGLSRSQVDKLGKRIGTTESLTSADLDLLELVKRERWDALLTVREAIGEAIPAGAVLTERSKTVGTIVEKLRREKTRLSTMQDVAGMRVVLDMTLETQDRLVEGIAGVLADPKIYDRRKEPRYGYRAVPVVETGGGPVEIQVRTHLQDAWAQTVERLCDVWGRQIRYGEPPTDPARPVGETETRTSFLAMIHELSHEVAVLEEAKADLERFRSAGSLADRLLKRFLLDFVNRRRYKGLMRRFGEREDQTLNLLTRCRRLLEVERGEQP